MGGELNEPTTKEETMTNASLQRKLAKLNRGAQEARIPAGCLGAYGGIPAADPETARAYLIEEQDRRRENLAEELLKILAEGAESYSFTDTHAKRTHGEGKDAYETETASLTVSEWAEKLAHAAVAAATVLYPEIPEPLNESLPTPEGGQ
jgi:crotonobetainyl-CoA:carnitine CoA-transferase CaiB-like acyl-CoA transferase